MRNILFPLGAFFSIQLLIATDMAYAENIIRTTAPVRYMQKTKPVENETPVINGLSILDSQIVDPSHAASVNFSLRFSFNAYNYDKLNLASSSGMLLDVSNSDSVTIKTQALSNETFHLEATKGENTVYSEAVTTKNLVWCKYSYQGDMYRSTPDSMTLWDRSAGLLGVTLPVGVTSYASGKWNYSYYSAEMNKWNNDGHYATCKSGSPINQDPNPKFLAQCPDYNYLNNRWVDNGSTQSVKFNGGGVNFSISLNQTKKYYDFGGWRYYPNPQDTGDNIYQICRHKIPY